jgi:hypothetical protein
MSHPDVTVRKLTISLPADLIDFADREAARRKISRSRLIAQALAVAEAAAKERLAAEGYRFYAGEAAEFAEASAGAVTEAWQDDRQER